MLIDTVKEFRTYYRLRKGKQEECSVSRLVYYLRCDSCGFDFTRTSKTFDKRSFAHVCSDCNQKNLLKNKVVLLDSITSMMQVVVKQFNYYAIFLKIILIRV